MWNFVTVMVALLCGAVLAHGNTLPEGTTEANCSNYIMPQCPRNYAPVCGDDGTTYPNECMLCFENYAKKTNIGVSSQGAC